MSKRCCFGCAAVGGWGQPITAAQVYDISANGEAGTVGEIAGQRRPSELGPSLTPAPVTCSLVGRNGGEVVWAQASEFSACM